jgi:indolepyruvate ferredoxin oxidoreductase alpha subunit
MMSMPAYVLRTFRHIREVFTAPGRNFAGPTDAIPVRKVLEGLGVKNIEEVDAYQQADLTAMVKKALARDELSVIIATHPCMLKLTRERRRKGEG